MGESVYSILVFFVVFILFLLLSLGSYWSRTHQSESTTNRFSANLSFRRTEPLTELTIEPGLDEASLGSFPMLLYSQAKLHNEVGDDNSAASSCSICLVDYKDNDMLRLLPDCGHLFHLNCVDSWLKMNPTCPICRKSPAPTPAATPLAEVTPLAMQPR